MLSALIEKIGFMRNPVSFCKKRGVKIGDKCVILGSSFPFGSEPYLITLGNKVRINAGVQFITHDGSVWVLRNLPSLDSATDLRDIDLFGPIKVGDNVQIGSNSIILPGVTIGSNVIIGAGAIVTKDIPDNSVAVGIPARVIESIEVFYHKHKDEFDHTKGFSAEQKRAHLKNKYEIR